MAMLSSLPDLANRVNPTPHFEAPHRNRRYNGPRPLSRLGRAHLVMNERSSPWWYRRRDAVFGMIYGLGFMAGGLISGALHGSYVPAYVACGNFAGRSGAFALLVAGTALTIACFALRLWGSSYLSEGIVWSDNARVDRLLADSTRSRCCSPSASSANV